MLATLNYSQPAQNVFNVSFSRSFLISLVSIRTNYQSHQQLWWIYRSSMATHITENVMCTALASAYGRYTVVTCHTQISLSLRLHLQLSGRYMFIPSSRFHWRKTPLVDIRLYCLLLQNLRPEIPRCCPSALANVMKRCWDANPDKRPEMDEVVSMIEAIDTSRGGGMIPIDHPQGCLCFRKYRGPWENETFLSMGTVGLGCYGQEIGIVFNSGKG